MRPGGAGWLGGGLAGRAAGMGEQCGPGLFPGPMFRVMLAGVVVRIILLGRCQCPSESSQPIGDGAGWLTALLGCSHR